MSQKNNTIHHSDAGPEISKVPDHEIGIKAAEPETDRVSEMMAPLADTSTDSYTVCLSIIQDELSEISIFLTEVDISSLSGDVVTQMTENLANIKQQLDGMFEIPKVQSKVIEMKEQWLSINDYLASLKDVNRHPMTESGSEENGALGNHGKDVESSDYNKTSSERDKTVQARNLLSNPEQCNASESFSDSQIGKTNNESVNTSGHRNSIHTYNTDQLVSIKDQLSQMSEVFTTMEIDNVSNETLTQFQNTLSYIEQFLSSIQVEVLENQQDKFHVSGLKEQWLALKEYIASLKHNCEQTNSALKETKEESATKYNSTETCGLPTSETKMSIGPTLPRSPDHDFTTLSVGEKENFPVGNVQHGKSGCLRRSPITGEDKIPKPPENSISSWNNCEKSAVLDLTINTLHTVENKAEESTEFSSAHQEDLTAQSLPFEVEEERASTETSTIYIRESSKSLRDISVMNNITSTNEKQFVGNSDPPRKASSEVQTIKTSSTSAPVGRETKGQDKKFHEKPAIPEKPIWVTKHLKSIKRSVAERSGVSSARKSKCDTKPSLPMTLTVSENPLLAVPVLESYKSEVINASKKMREKPAIPIKPASKGKLAKSSGSSVIKPENNTTQPAERIEQCSEMKPGGNPRNTFTKADIPDKPSPEILKSSKGEINENQFVMTPARKPLIPKKPAFVSKTAENPIKSVVEKTPSKSKTNHETPNALYPTTLRVQATENSIENFNAKCSISTKTQDSTEQKSGNQKVHKEDQKEIEETAIELAENIATTDIVELEELNLTSNLTNHTRETSANVIKIIPVEDEKLEVVKPTHDTNSTEVTEEDLSSAYETKDSFDLKQSLVNAEAKFNQLGVTFQTILQHFPEEDKLENKSANLPVFKRFLEKFNAQVLMADNSTTEITQFDGEEQSSLWENCIRALTDYLSVLTQIDRALAEKSGKESSPSEENQDSLTGFGVDQSNQNLNHPRPELDPVVSTATNSDYVDQQTPESDLIEKKATIFDNVDHKRPESDPSKKKTTNTDNGDHQRSEPEQVEKMATNAVEVDHQRSELDLIENTVINSENHHNKDGENATSNVDGSTSRGKFNAQKYTWDHKEAISNEISYNSCKGESAFNTERGRGNSYEPKSGFFVNVGKNQVASLIQQSSMIKNMDETESFSPKDKFVHSVSSDSLCGKEHLHLVEGLDDSAYLEQGINDKDRVLGGQAHATDTEISEKMNQEPDGNSDDIKQSRATSSDNNSNLKTKSELEKAGDEIRKCLNRMKIWFEVLHSECRDSLEEQAAHAKILFDRISRDSTSLDEESVTNGIVTLYNLMRKLHETRVGEDESKLANTLSNSSREGTEDKLANSSSEESGDRLSNSSIDESDDTSWSSASEESDDMSSVSIDSDYETTIQTINGLFSVLLETLLEHQEQTQTQNLHEEAKELIECIGSVLEDYRKLWDDENEPCALAPGDSVDEIQSALTPGQHVDEYKVSSELMEDALPIWDPLEESTTLNKPRKLPFPLDSSQLLDMPHDIIERVVDILNTSFASSDTRKKDNDDITLSVWDFAGQELYYTSHQVGIVFL